MTAASSNRSSHVFQSLWVGRRLSPLEHLCIKSFLSHGHTFVLHVYNEVENVPRGCALGDARVVLPPERIFRQQSGYFRGTLSTFSNQFRYQLLRTRGGWWVDTDVVCLTPDIPDTAYAFAMQSEESYSGAILKAPPESAFLAEAVRLSAQAGGDIPYAEIGPKLVDKLVRELHLEGEAWPRRTLYPLRWDEVPYLFDPMQAEVVEERIASSSFLHIYTNLLRLGNVLKDVRPPASSFLDRLYAAYEIGFPTDLRYEWAEMESQYVFQNEHWSLMQEARRLDAEVRELGIELERRDASNQARERELHDRLKGMDQLLTDVLSSASWRITKPLRALKHRWRQFRSPGSGPRG